MNIDVDSHFLPLDMFKHISSRAKDLPRLVIEKDGGAQIAYRNLGRKRIRDNCTEKGIPSRIQAMREAGFDKQCLLVHNGSIPDPYLSNESGVALCRSWNDSVARVCEEYDCFVGVAQVPHLNVDSSIQEAERAVKDLGFRAIEIHGRWGDGQNVESREWWPFFDAVERMDVPLWFHTFTMAVPHVYNPWMPASDMLKRFPPYVNGLMGFLIHTEMVCAGLIFGGVTEEFPRLKFVMTECDAGWVPSFMDWMDMIRDAQLMKKQEGALQFFVTSPSSEEVRLSKRPSQHLRDHFFFTLSSTNGFSMDTLVPFLVNKIRLESNMMIESDYDHAEGSLDIVRRVRRLKEVSEEAKEKICGKNAAELLGIKWAPSMYAWE